MPTPNETTHALAGMGPSGTANIREFAERWVIMGQLVLDSAAHFGNGEEGDAVDMPLVRDRIDRRPLLTGASLAGALRDYVNDRLLAFGKAENHGSVAARLFGGSRGDDEGSQSPLIVFDARADADCSEIRDGVAIDAKMGTAAKRLKFDCEVIPAGVAFSIRLELLVTDSQDRDAQLSCLAAALAGLQCGEIRLGARKNRGCGMSRARQWAVRRFDLSTPNGWTDWLRSDHMNPIPTATPRFDSITEALQDALPGLRITPEPDRRRRLVVTVHLRCPGGLLIRSPGTEADSPDAVHLRSGARPVLSGTSLAGVLRSRALRVAQLVRGRQNDPEAWVDGVFGSLTARSDKQGRDRRKMLRASRLRTSEQAIAGSSANSEPVRLRPARIRVDRFTSGVVDGALFDEEPVYGGHVTFTLELRDPRPGETGLLLLVLKDLLIRDLPLGGSSSVGRGVVEGMAEILLPEAESPIAFDPSRPSDAATVRHLNALTREFHEAPALASADSDSPRSKETREP